MDRQGFRNMLEGRKVPTEKLDDARQNITFVRLVARKVFLTKE